MELAFKACFNVELIVDPAAIREWLNLAVAITYEAGKDYRFVAGTHQIEIPVGSRVVTKLPSQLRRPDTSQCHKLTHRDDRPSRLASS